jgi:hypothetical protein
MTVAPDTGGALDLPPLQRALLDEATLNQLFLDVAEAAELIDIAIKRGDEMHATEEPPSLEQARDALVRGKAFGVQLRYRYRGTEWWDTLMRTEAGVCLVRFERPHER